MARGNKGRKAPSHTKGDDTVHNIVETTNDVCDQQVPAARDAKTHAPAKDSKSSTEAPVDSQPTGAVPEADSADKSSQTNEEELPQKAPTNDPGLREGGPKEGENPIMINNLEQEPVDYLLQLSPEERERDLRNQVTSLNSKLVMSFNRISDLEDDLSVAHNRILAHTTHIAELHKEREQHLFALNTGLLVEKAHVTSEMQRMMDRVLDETAQRGKAESDKSRIETELEELSASLFNEANKMVAVERLERARAEEKSAQLQESLRDTERILAEQQDMLKNLQQKIEQGQLGEEVSQEVPDREPTLASARFDPSLSINIQPYHEFISFVEYLRSLQHQLAPYNRLQQRGVDWTTIPTLSQTTASGSIGGVMSPALTGPVPPIRHKDYPHLPSSAEQLVQVSNQSSLPFIRRAQDEDSDPCLRLGHAPGLNWLSRRQASSAVLEGTLVIEPIFAGGVVDDEFKIRAEYGSLPPVPCTLCGTPLVDLMPLIVPHASEGLTNKEGGQRRSLPALFQSLRRSVSHSDRAGDSRHENSEIFSQEGAQNHSSSIPTHYFRVSDSSNKYLVCSHYCLQRLRAVCGFWMFVRTLERAIVLEGKSCPDLVGGTKIATGDPTVGPMNESVQGAAEAHQVEMEVEAVHKEEEHTNASKKEEAPQHDEKDVKGKESDNREAEDEEEVFDEAQGFADKDEGDARSSESIKEADAKNTVMDDTHRTSENQEHAPKAADVLPVVETNMDAMVPPEALPENVPPLPRRVPAPPTLPARTHIARSSFHPFSDKGTLTWEESLWAELMRLKEAMWKARTGVDLDIAWR